MKGLPFIIVFFCCCKAAFAQDVHWSQYNDNPVFLNPANSANFNGNSRFVANYRNQWRSVTKPFQSFSASYDTPLKNRDFGLGVLVLNDQTGDGKFKTLEVQLNPSYRIPLNTDSTHQLISGLQVALNQRQFNFSKFYFDEQYNGSVYDPNLPVTEAIVTQKKTSISLGAGFAYQYKRNRKQVYELGLSAFNINQPNQGFYGEKIKRDLRLTLYAKGTLNLKKNLFLIPTLLFQTQGTFRELVLGTRLKYQLIKDEKNYKALYGGISYRNKDAIFLTAGLDYQQWYLGVSYDINTSTLKPASGGKGGMELCLRYIIKRFKPKQIQHRICPEFI